MRTCFILATVLMLAGCAILGGKHHVMSYSVETTANDSSNEVVFSATISGR